MPVVYLPSNTRGSGAEYRNSQHAKPSALQQAVMKFADHTSGYVINPSVGTEFDSCDEAYEYYNLYSWECGFGIRWGKKRWSENRRKNNGPEAKPYQLSQDFFCSCRVSYSSNRLLYFACYLIVLCLHFPKVT